MSLVGCDHCLHRGFCDDNASCLPLTFFCFCLMRFDVLLAPEDELDVKQVLETVNGEMGGNGLEGLGKPSRTYTDMYREKNQ